MTENIENINKKTVLEEKKDKIKQKIAKYEECLIKAKNELKLIEKKEAEQEIKNLTKMLKSNNLSVEELENIIKLNKSGGNNG